MTEQCTLILGDCLEELRKLPDNYVDLIITDPPYNISQEGKKITRNKMNFKTYKREKDISLDFGNWDKFKTEDEYFKFTEDWFKECSRILKNKGWFYIFFDKFRTGYFDLFLSKKYGINPKTIIIWRKTNPAPHFRKVNWLSSTEFIWVGSKGKSGIKNYEKWKDMQTVIDYPNSSIYGETNHPTEKPIFIVSKFIRVNTNENEIIFDPFMGSGTIGVASLLLNRRFIGIEKDINFFNMAKDRLKPHIEQKRIIEKW